MFIVKRRVIGCITVLALLSGLAGCGAGGSAKLLPLTLQSKNLLQDAVVSQAKDNDAQNLLEDNHKCWTPKYEGENCTVEIKLARTSTFNLAVIEEKGSAADYFRLQVWEGDDADGRWITVYQGEQIRAQRLCSFEPVTTDRIRLSIDKMDEGSTAKIKSVKLYNEPAREAPGFQTAVYQRLDGDVPTEVLAQGEEYAATYARYYDVYNTVIVFDAVKWDGEGNMLFGDVNDTRPPAAREAEFARELEALKELIARRSNPAHEVKLIVTALADGANANDMMKQYLDKVTDQIVEFAAKYALDGVDIDWEYPANAEDWNNFDAFITALDEGLKAQNPEAILSGALSAFALGMSADVLARFDQIQYMAYDGRDDEGLQSTLDLAQQGLAAFAAKGADVSRINIGIAAYGRPLDGRPYWPFWRGLEQANAWDHKYLNVTAGGALFDAAFCPPAVAGEKAAYALYSGAGGVMVFRLACDKLMDDPLSLARGLENTLKRSIAGW